MTNTIVSNMPTIGYTNDSPSNCAKSFKSLSASLIECVRVRSTHATTDAIKPAKMLSIIIYCDVLICWMRHSLNLHNVLKSLYFRFFLESISRKYQPAIYETFGKQNIKEYLNFTYYA